MKYDLAWGNSICVREAFVNTYHGNPMTFSRDELRDFNYPTHEGDAELVEITKKVIQRQTQQEYKHVFLVNGATGGCTIALRAYAQMGARECLTRNAPFYIRYPSMIAASGLKQVQEDNFKADSITMALLDLPSNPLGLMSNIAKIGMPLVIDGVYLNRVYVNLFRDIPDHTTMIGSYSKLLGINGIRIGWLATNDDILAARFKDLVTSEYCGLSQASTDLLKHVLEGFEWDKFEKSARFKLDCNREEWSRLEKFFQETPVTNTGMFYYAPMDNKAQEIFTKANIIWTKGSAMGTDNGFARFNLGQNNDLVEEAVEAILKADKIK